MALEERVPDHEDMERAPGARPRLLRLSEEGERLRVGDRLLFAQIMGRPRSYMVWLPWVAMMAAGIVEYAYGSAAKTLQASYHWSDTETFTLTGVWGFFQAGIALPPAG